MKVFWKFSAFFSLSEISDRNKPAPKVCPTLHYEAQMQGIGSSSIVGHSPEEKFSLWISETSEQLRFFILQRAPCL